eukprot:c12471_g1_i4.p1 GENE.c12471_g1_i4~~c12471_g1_i4.p1  ORF type:complete len:197 (+),score=45.37 c12471_g1_i4:83-592(+)
MASEQVTLGDLVVSDVHLGRQLLSPLLKKQQDIPLRLTNFALLPTGPLHMVVSQRRKEIEQQHHRQADTTDDHDSDVPRKRRRIETQEELGLRIVHRCATPLKLVGQQVWTGALQLSDVVAHLGSSDHLRSITCLELGCGTGLVSLVAACFCPLTIATGKQNKKLLLKM